MRRAGIAGRFPTGLDLPLREAAGTGPPHFFGPGTTFQELFTLCSLLEVDTVSVFVYASTTYHLRETMNFLAALVLGLLLGFTPVQSLAANASDSPAMKPLPIGQAFPDIAFKGPLSATEAKDLGVDAADKTIRFSQLKTEAIILVVFSMYCPFCQKEGTELDKMHKLIGQKGLADKVKLVGLGAGNSAFEVNIYREKFGLGFPLFPDQDFEAYKALGQVGTPYYYILKRRGSEFIIVDEQLGCVASPGSFLDRVLEKTGMAKGK
jgi:peroxiredoxin